MSRLFRVLATCVLLLLPDRDGQAAPRPMSREQILKLGNPVRSSSYWWGGSTWRQDGSCPGRCKVPGCTASPSCYEGYPAGCPPLGADCSGFVSKVWQVPSPSRTDRNTGHGYTTSWFKNTRVYWSAINRSATKPADSLVYDNGRQGHIVLFVRGNPMGSPYVLECASCRTGCRAGTKYVDSAYVARQRDLLVDLKDTDKDGVPDIEDNCKRLANRNQRDTDDDGLGDACDKDDDGDRIADRRDNCPLVKNPKQWDADRDGRGNACDPDDDNDGRPDVRDNCQYVRNRAQTDIDHDGKGDACDADLDNDKVLNTRDNCPRIRNKDQRDTDGDGRGDACENDDDADGAPDTHDNCKKTPNPNQSDVDQDGLGDRCDKDADGDGVLNRLDNCPYETNRQQADGDQDGRGDACDDDADNDGIPDDQDNCPQVANADQADFDEDEIGDVCDGDDDGDDVEDSIDNCPGLENADQGDGDGDGVGDQCDQDYDWGLGMGGTQPGYGENDEEDDPANPFVLVEPGDPNDPMDEVDGELPEDLPDPLDTEGELDPENLPPDVVDPSEDPVDLPDLPDGGVLEDPLAPDPPVEGMEDPEDEVPPSDTSDIGVDPSTYIDPADPDPAGTGTPGPSQTELGGSETLDGGEGSGDDPDGGSSDGEPSDGEPGGGGDGPGDEGTTPPGAACACTSPGLDGGLWLSLAVGMRLLRRRRR